jgi:hypothetical protein
MWLMSQEQGLWPERSQEARFQEGRSQESADDAQDRFRRPAGEPRPRLPVMPDFADQKLSVLPPARRTASDVLPRENTAASFTAFGKSALADPFERTSEIEAPPAEESDAGTEWSSADEDFAPETAHRLTLSPLPLAAGADVPVIDDSRSGEADPVVENEGAIAPPSMLRTLRDLRVKLRFRRADVYLGVAIFVAAFALLWPAAGSTRPVTPTLSTWDRALIALGIAEAPAPEVHLQGDPSIQVWIDPHTALYYCPGEEQYGKAANGHYSTQREAQMDRFEPAGRSACE